MAVGTRLLIVGALAVGAAGCGVGNEVGAMQIPAVVSGHVLAGPTCPAPSPSAPCPDRPLPGAVVQAIGKDGTHTVVADATGAYTIRLLLGRWTLSATGGVGGRGGRPVTIDVVQGQHRRVDLYVDTGLR